MQLWETSGHAANYKENMFVFDIEKQEFGLKPMNCPGHCLMFDYRVRSYRELPLHLADFGVLHRNEASGALTCLTRVRRFQQDDTHIFCRESQIKDEVKSVLEFIDYPNPYGVFGFTYELKLSTLRVSSPILLHIAYSLLGITINVMLIRGGHESNSPLTDLHCYELTYLYT